VSIFSTDKDNGVSKDWNVSHQSH